MSESNFAVGDRVVTRLGLGTITDIVEMTVLGETLEYLVIKNSVVKDLTEKIPVTSLALRKPSNPQSLRTALKGLAKPPKSVRGNPDQVARSKRRALSSLKVSDVVELIRDTYTPPNKTRTNAYIEFYEPALNRLTHEMAYVFEVSLADAVTHVETLLNTHHDR